MDLRGDDLFFPSNLQAERGCPLALAAMATAPCESNKNMCGSGLQKEILGCMFMGSHFFTDQDHGVMEEKPAAIQD